MLPTSVASDNVSVIDKILRQRFNKQLFYPKQDDQYRLLKLKMWSERHKVSIEYILSVLIPYFEKMSYKHARKAREKISKGIGTTIPTLTGQAAEVHLLDQIHKDFPDSENVVSWNEAKKQECIQKVENEDSDGIVSKHRHKGVLDYPTLAAFRKAYVTRITNKRIHEEKLIKQLSKQPWRGNPFR